MTTGPAPEIRPFEPADLPAVRGFYEHLSLETRARRFWSFSWSGPQWELDHLASDPSPANPSPTVVAWFGGVPVGVARCQRADDEPSVGHVGIVVDDAWQGAGLGHRLGEALVRASRRAGIERLAADVRVDNPASLALFRHGFPAAHATWEDGAVHFAIDLSAA